MREHPVQSLLKQGLSYKRICEILGVSKSTVNYQAKKLGIAKTIRKCTYNWDKISEDLNSGMSTVEARKKYGFSYSALDKAYKSGRIQDNRKLTYRMNATEYSVFHNNKRASTGIRRGLRKRLILEGTEERCVKCKLTTWNDQKIPLEVDHIDGDSSNNKLDNLRFLCLNCHSQTETWRGRNTKRKKQIN